MRPWRKAARERKEKGARRKEKGKSRNPPKAAHSAAVHGGTLALGALGARHGSDIQGTPYGCRNSYTGRNSPVFRLPELSHSGSASL